MAEPVVEPQTDDAMHQQAVAMAEAIQPQLEALVDQRMATEVEGFSAGLRAELQSLGVLGEDGDPVRPPAAPDAAPLFASLGEQLMAIQAAAHPGAQVDPRLGQIMAATGMSEGVPADGGFLLQDTNVNEIWRLTHDTGQVFNRITRGFPLSANSNSIRMPGIDETSRADGSRGGGTRAFWVEEGGTLTASKPTFKRISLELNKLIALTYATSEQLADTPVIERLINDGFSDEFGFQLDEAAINGSGVGEPLGVLNADALVTQAKETGQTKETIVFQNILKMWSRGYARSRPNFVWFINQDCEPELYNMSMAVGTGGVPVYLPANGISGSPFSTLFGRPVIPIEQCSTLGTVGDIILADMSQYWEIEKSFQSASSIHVQFLTDEVAFRGTARLDYRPIWLSALTPFKGSSTTTVSPFVVLATRA